MSAQPSLKRCLGLRDSLAMVVGPVIGTGIFLKAAVMTQELESGIWVIVAWFAAGVLSLLGAMTFAELGALFPQAGGGYVYVREGFGKLPAFLYGWMSFLIIGPGSVAAYSVAAGTFLNGVFPNSQFVSFTPLAVILFFSLLNCLAISFGGAVQTALTMLKVLLIIGLGISIFIFIPESKAAAFNGFFDGSLKLQGFGGAVLAALWAYDGWDGLPRIASEVKDPQRNIPKALIIGILTIFAIYLLANLSYFWALPIQEIAQSNSSTFPDALPVATRASIIFLGDKGMLIISVMMVISCLGAMNGSIITNARVPYAMASDGLLMNILGKVSANTRVPVVAVLVQGGIACLLAISGTFDQLTNYVIFSAWIFYGLAAIALFVFRMKRPELKRTYHVPGYPFVPAAFIILTAILLINTVIQNPIDSLVGLGFMLLGVPAYYVLRRT